MARDNRIMALVKDAQKRVFRLAERDYGLTLKAISLDSGIPYNTIRNYAGNNGEQCAMSVPALLMLVDVIPDDLLSQLLDPVRRALVPVNSEGEPDYDAIGQHALDLGMTVAQARSQNSPGGTNIVPIERNAIDAKLARVSGRAA